MVTKPASSVQARRCAASFHLCGVNAFISSLWCWCSHLDQLVNNELCRSVLLCNREQDELKLYSKKAHKLWAVQLVFQPALVHMAWSSMEPVGRLCDINHLSRWGKVDQKSTQPELLAASRFLTFWSPTRPRNYCMQPSIVWPKRHFTAVFKSIKCHDEVSCTLDGFPGSIYSTNWQLGSP